MRPRKQYDDKSLADLYELRREIVAYRRVNRKVGFRLSVALRARVAKVVRAALAAGVPMVVVSRVSGLARSHLRKHFARKHPAERFHRVVVSPATPTADSIRFVAHHRAASTTKLTIDLGNSITIEVVGLSRETLLGVVAGLKGAK